MNVQQHFSHTDTFILLEHEHRNKEKKCVKTLKRDQANSEWKNVRRKKMYLTSINLSRTEKLLLLQNEAFRRLSVSIKCVVWIQKKNEVHILISKVKITLLIKRNGLSWGYDANKRCYLKLSKNKLEHVSSSIRRNVSYFTVFFFLCVVDIYDLGEPQVKRLRTNINWKVFCLTNEINPWEIINSMKNSKFTLHFYMFCWCFFFLALS